jgi:beta-mannosidase
VLTSPKDFSIDSSVFLSRIHHPPANSFDFPNPNAPQGRDEIVNAVQTWLPTPGTKDKNQTFAQWCYSSQVFQSLVRLTAVILPSLWLNSFSQTIGAEIAWYRWGAGKAENNLGGIVWQLNDIWESVSWSAIEHSGRLV